MKTEIELAREYFGLSEGCGIEKQTMALLRRHDGFILYCFSCRLREFLLMLFDPPIKVAEFFVNKLTEFIKKKV